MIHTAKVVAIFWGAEWSGSGAATASHITGFFQNFGTTGEYKVITQYGDGGGNVNATSIDTTSFFDGSAPPANVTDSAIQGEVARYVDAHQGGVGDPSTVYEVFLPSTSYASLGSSTSCGGPNLQFCAYHSDFIHNGVDVKYSSMPYPGCGGCQPGFSVLKLRLLLSRDTGSGDGPGRQRLVRPPRVRSGRQVRLVAGPLPRCGFRLSVRVVQRRARVRSESALTLSF